MTRAEQSPVTRIVSDGNGKELVVTVEGRTCTIRPYRHPKGGPAEILVSWGRVYERALIARVDPLPSRTKPKR